jgi:hypothetical protein
MASTALAGGLLLVGVLGFTLATGGRAVADQSVGLVGLADASGVRVTYTVPNFLVLTTIADGGGPIAQSTLNTSGESDGYASMPYPGNTAVTAPGLLAVLLGQDVPVTYPLYVEANAPLTPTAHAQDVTGTLVLDAAADANHATGSASLGQAAGSLQLPESTTSTSVTVDPSGVMTVTADATTQGINIGNGLLAIGSVHTHSVTTFHPGDAKPTTTSSTEVDAASVAGTPIGIGPNGITLLGNAGGALDPVLNLLNSALAQGGISIHTVASQNIEGGESTSALEIDSSQQIPAANKPTGTLVVLLGNTMTSISQGAAGILAPPTETPAAPSLPVTVTPPFSAPSFTSSPLSTPAPVTATPAASSPLPKTAAPSVVLLAKDLRHTTRYFFLVLAIGGALLLALTYIWRKKGVQATWMS